MKKPLSRLYPRFSRGLLGNGSRLLATFTRESVVPSPLCCNCNLKLANVSPFRTPLTRSAQGAVGVKANVKAVQGELYFLERGLLFIAKQPILVDFSKTESIAFSRVGGAGGLASARTFDIRVVSKTGSADSVFSAIPKEEASGISAFLASKNVRLKNEMEEAGGDVDMDDLDDLDDLDDADLEGLDDDDDDASIVSDDDGKRKGKGKGSGREKGRGEKEKGKTKSRADEDDESGEFVCFSCSTST